MSSTDVILVSTALVGALCLLHPRVTRAPLWHATVTPLAAIIGSGFLVAGPILGATAGVWAWAAMAGLCALAYLFGEAVRHNIAHVEPMLAAGAPRPVVAVERAAGIALSLAYFVSVAYYLNLFAAFALRIGGITDPFWIRCLATAAIAVIGLLALRGGEAAMERVAVPVVGVKLSIILAIIAALGVATIGAAAGGTLRWPAIDHPDPGRMICASCWGSSCWCRGSRRPAIWARFTTDPRASARCAGRNGWLAPSI